MRGFARPSFGHAGSLPGAWILRAFFCFWPRRTGSSAPLAPPRSASRRTPRTFSRPLRFTCSNASTPTPAGARTGTQSAHSCTSHKTCTLHRPCKHGTSTRAASVRHTHTSCTSTIHLAAAPAPRVAAMALCGHFLALLPPTLPHRHFHTTAHSHTARSTRVAHDTRTHLGPSHYTWPNPRHRAAPAPPPTHTSHPAASFAAAPPDAPALPPAASFADAPPDAPAFLALSLALSRDHHLRRLFDCRRLHIFM